MGIKNYGFPFSYPHCHTHHEIDSSLREIAVLKVFAEVVAHVGAVNPSVAAIALVENIVDGETEIQRLEGFLLPVVIDVQVADEIRVEAALQI